MAGGVTFEEVRMSTGGSGLARLIDAVWRQVNCRGERLFLPLQMMHSSGRSR